MINLNKCFEKKNLSLYGMVLVSSFAVLLVFFSSQSQYVAAQTNSSMMMMEDEMGSTNQTKGHDMSETDMNMMNMMEMMMNMMEMMMNMMEMSSDMSGGMEMNMSDSSAMNMSAPMAHSQGGSNMSMMMMPPQ